jgi:hypothetical protein
MPGIPIAAFWFIQRRARYLSQLLPTLWLRADAHTPRGDVGPTDFDAVTNSREPDVKSFAMTTEGFGSERAAIAVTIVGHNRPHAKSADAIVRYDFVRHGPQWMIERRQRRKACSIRSMLTDSLKNYPSRNPPACCQTDGA